MSATHGGKGSKQRPTSKEAFDDNYDKIFGKNKGGNCRSYSTPEQCRNNKACAYCKRKEETKVK